MKSDEFNEAEVQQILSRAVQIDAAAPERLKVDQIRAIAAELGVSQAAVERAIEEYSGNRIATPQRTPGTRAAPVRKSWIRQPLTIAVLIVAGLMTLVFASRIVVERPAEAPEVRIEVPGR